MNLNPIFSLAQFQGILPELIVLIGALAVLALDIPLRAQKDKAAVAGLSAVTLALALAVLVLNWGKSFADPFPGMLKADPLANAAKLTMLVIGLLTLAIGRGIAVKLRLIHAEYYSLLLFALSAMMFFAGCSNLMASFVALETFSLAMYVLAGFNRMSRLNREAALKYFLIGALAAAFLLFGIAIVYGTTGSVNLDDLASTLKGLPAADPRGRLLYGGIAMLLVGLGFKVGLAPFHLWAPDTYEGAPSPVTAFLSAGAKVAGFALLLRVAAAVPMASPVWLSLVSVLAVLTMVLGNLGALKQSGLKRLMAYSSIAHSGYALVALTGGPAAASAVMNYVLVYAVMNYASFALIIALETQVGEESLTLANIEGLGFEKPLYSFCLAVCMFAMAGIPPTAGFVAKLNVFKVALEAGQTKLVVIAVLNSVLSASYYLRVLVSLYMKPKTAATTTPALNGWLLGSALLSVILLLAWGVLPASLLRITSF